MDISRGLIADWRELDVEQLDALARELEENARQQLHRADAVYDSGALAPGPAVVGPALIEYPFTTLLLRPGDAATMRPNGDMLVAIG